MAGNSDAFIEKESDYKHSHYLGDIGARIKLYTKLYTKLHIKLYNKHISVIKYAISMTAGGLKSFFPLDKPIK